MKILLQLSDIHVLVDLDSSPSTEFEFLQSSLAAKRAKTSALSLNFGWNPMVMGRVFRPVSIRISSEPRRDKFSGIKSTGTVAYKIGGNPTEFQNRLRRQIELAQRIRYQRIESAIRLTPRIARLMKAPDPDTPGVLQTCMKISAQLQEGHSIAEVRSALSAEFKHRVPRAAQKVIPHANALDSYTVRLRAGTVMAPRSFADSYARAKTEALKRIASSGGEKYASSRLMRVLVSILAFLATIKLRRLSKNQQHTQ